MNRLDFQMMAHLRLDEAERLLAAESFSGAYYLAGYVVECALKACIAKSVQEHEFPEKKRVNDSYSHDLTLLLKTAALEQELKAARQRLPGLGQRWDTVQEWNEVSRYRIWERADAESMVDAVGNRNEGVLLWLTQHW